jgi:hypothetical protein
MWIWGGTLNKGVWGWNSGDLGPSSRVSCMILCRSLYLWETWFLHVQNNTCPYEHDQMTQCMYRYFIICKGWVMVGISLHTAFILISAIPSILMVKKQYTLWLSYYVAQYQILFLPDPSFPIPPFLLYTEELYNGQQDKNDSLPSLLCLSPVRNDKKTFSGMLEPVCTVSSTSSQLYIQWSHMDDLKLATVSEGNYAMEPANATNYPALAP